ncbi:MAG TPA: hypothetical protein VGX23_04245 [Actinocrinis sp.]|nr:hypothetical protein [Actinocrinis sp.]
MNTLTDLQAAHDRLDELAREPGVDPIELSAAINAALAPQSVLGSPADIRAHAQAYGQVGLRCETVAADLAGMADTALPAAWQGQVAETAAEAVKALADEICAIQTVMAAAAEALTSWAHALDQAQQADQAGVAHLDSALRIVSGYDMVSGQPEIKALPLARTGVAARIDAAQRARTAGVATASLLNQYAAQARARQVSTMDLDALSAVVLSAQTNTGAYGLRRDILNSSALALGSQRLDALAAADRAAFEALLGRCASPQEAAFLWKALAAGHPLTEVRAFAAAIHPHGADQAWLTEHLAVGFDDPRVAFGRDPAATGLSYQGQGWSEVDPAGYDVYDQGTTGDCVSASTVVAHANLDPVLMLKLTTGYGQSAGTHPAPGDDSPSAFQQRLQQLYLEQYAVGQNADGFAPSLAGHGSGIGTRGEDALANQQLGAPTGGTYTYQDLHSVADRRAVLPRIEAAVDAGKPVLFDVVGPSGGHQLVVVGRQGDQFEVYNPWGFTEQISESGFVAGRLGQLTAPQVGGPPGAMPTAAGIELPD